MSIGNKIFIRVMLPVVFITGIITGRVVEDFPFIKWDSKVDFISALNLLVTIAIGIMIPFLIKKIIDDNRDIKTFLVGEVKDLIVIIAMARDIISTAYQSSEFKSSDKDKIIFIFHSAEQKIGSIAEQLEISFKKQSPGVIKDIKEGLLTYKRYLTDSEMMVSTFDKVTDNFYKENNNEFSKLETILKKSIHCIHKF